MKKFTSILATFAILAFVAGSALADSPANAGRASELIGALATSDSGEFLGTVDDVIVSSDGQASYVVIAKSDQARFVALPYQFADPHIKSSGKVQLAISREKFDTAPSYAKSELAELSKPTNDTARGYRGSMDDPPNMINGIGTANPYPNT